MNIAHNIPDIDARSRGVPRTESLTKAGAEQMARNLTLFWQKMDYPHVRHWIEPILTDEGGKCLKYYSVRSNLVNGCPPRSAQEAIRFAAMNKAP